MEARRLTIDNRLLLIYDNFDLNEINVLEDYVKNKAKFTKFGGNLKQTSNAALSHMYSEENEILFI